MKKNSMYPDKRKLLIGELQRLLDELKQLRSGQLKEIENSTRSEHLARRVELARGKLDDLKTLQKREREVQKRRREIDRENRRRN
jgi:hypothetical protein